MEENKKYIRRKVLKNMKININMKGEERQEEKIILLDVGEEILEENDNKVNREVIKCIKRVKNSYSLKCIHYFLTRSLRFLLRIVP